MKNTGKTRLQTQAISALLTKPTIEAAAKSCGMQQPKFQEQYAQAKHDLLEGAVNRLRTAGFDAGMRLHKIVNDPDAPITAVVSAAGRLLELLLKSVEIEDLSKRLDRLEASMRAEQ